MNQSSSNKILWLNIILSAALFLACLVGVYLIYKKNISTQDLLTKVEEGNKNAVLIESLKPGEATDNKINSLNSLALTKDQLVGFIENLENTAKGFGLATEITSVSNEEGKGDSPDKIHIQISTSGSWKGTISFVHALESFPYRVTINSNQMMLDKNGSALGLSSSTPKQAWKTNSEIVIYSF